MPPPGPSQPDAQANAYLAHGNALFALGQWDEAAGRYRAALALEPQRAELHFNLANALVRTGAIDAALSAFELALALDPGHAGAHSNLGNLLRALGRPGEALEHYRRAVHLRPGDAAQRYNLGTALADLERLEEAETWFSQAVRMQPPHPEAVAALGTLLLRRGRPADALPWFRAARQQGDNAPATVLGEGLSLLTLGNLREGWEGYEARPIPTPFLADGHTARWTGTEPVQGRTILVWAEQGLGDSIQFARYLPLLRARGARVVLLAQRPLHRLLAGLVDAVVAEGDTLRFDLHCPLLSLPRAFGTELASIPADIPYLAADSDRVAHWRHTLGPGPHVGLAWSGNPDHPLDRLRSLPFATLAPLLDLPHIRWHVLQTPIRPQDVMPLAGQASVQTYTASLGDFADTAALASAMDLVISADTSVAHLAGALGRPTWIMLPYAADFRWLRDRTDTPWYPTARLFRQPRPGDWPAVVAAVRKEGQGALPPGPPPGAEPLDLELGRSLRRGG